MDELRDSVVEACEDDWVYFAEFVQISRDVAEVGENPLTCAGEVAAHFVGEGLIVPGELTDAGFVPWQLSRSEAAERIRREVAAMVREDVRLYPGDVCWFELAENAQGPADVD
ncbi:hypothetical protein [Goodfellowiella coeruleoviolacea]|nr:hypothetical protein [Goodfellowiella coeruleoviolacea]